ncbi:hypothetical protein D3C78_1429120 [compost metagenome]
MIDDVIREAKVSRCTFYLYFDSLDQVLVALGQDLSNQMTTDILPLYDILEEPWKRISVGFRGFLVHALLGRKWGPALPEMASPATHRRGHATFRTCWRGRCRTCPGTECCSGQGRA